MEMIDKKQLLLALKRRLWIMIFFCVIGAASFFGVARFLITPEYEAGVKLYVNNSSFSVGGASFSISASELTAAQGLVDTYIVILNSRTTINEVIKEANLTYSYEDLCEMITAEPINETEIFQITITSTDPNEAEKIANTIAMVLPGKIAEIVDGSSVRVVEYAIVPTRRAAPSYSKSVVLGGIVGTVLSATIVLFYEMLDDKMRSEETLTRAYPDVPLLSVIPDATENNGMGAYRGYYQEYRPNGRNRTEAKR
ncbi:MAG: hypothetical protein E7434_06040 [Ruminococcaceae bacterium]|nr:hypothetical protein [Oscillospiraceae bacterium]